MAPTGRGPIVYIGLIPGSVRNRYPLHIHRVLVVIGAVEVDLDVDIVFGDFKGIGP